MFQLIFAVLGLSISSVGANSVVYLPRDGVWMLREGNALRNLAFCVMRLFFLLLAGAVDAAVVRAEGSGESNATRREVRSAVIS